MTKTQEPTHIIVKNLNALRWLCPNQCFVTNVLHYSADAVEFLQENKIDFSLAIKLFDKYKYIES